MKRLLLVAVTALVLVAPATTEAASTSCSQATRMAKSYLASQGFSKSGLVEQLQYEGFSRSDASCGASHAGANWYAQAVKVARSYLRSQAFSRSGLIEQLEYEGFTYAQATLRRESRVPLTARSAPRGALYGVIQAPSRKENEMEGPRRENVPLSQLQVDEELWGPGAEPIVKDWLREHYDPGIMPPLQVITITGRDGYWVLGWQERGADGQEWPSLLHLIFGEAYAEQRLEQTRAGIDDPGGPFGEGPIPPGSFGLGADMNTGWEQALEVQATLLKQINGPFWGT